MSTEILLLSIVSVDHVIFLNSSFMCEIIIECYEIQIWFELTITEILINSKFSSLIRSIQHFLFENETEREQTIYIGA